MFACKKFASVLRSLSYGRPQYMFMKGLQKYKAIPPPEETIFLLNRLEDRLFKKELNDKQIAHMIQKKFFLNQINNILQQEQNLSINLRLDDKLSENQLVRLEKLQQEVITLLESKSLDKLNKFYLYEQTLMLDDVQKHFMEKVLKSEFTFQKQTLHQLLEFLCKQYDILFKKSSDYVSAIDLSKFSTLIENFQRKDVMQRLTLLDIGLLLNIDYALFRKQIQQQLITRAAVLISSIKTFESDEHLRGLQLIYKFIRRRKVKFDLDLKLLFHLIEVLPIQVLNSIMKQVRLTNYEYPNVIKIYEALQKKHFSQQNAQNIPLLSTMNVYMPAMNVANFYLNHLQSLFDQSDYFELVKILPFYINLFHPQFDKVAYFSEHVQVKLSTSNYQKIDSECTKEEKIVFIRKLSRFLISILRGDLIKNDFFLLKTLMFIHKNTYIIEDKKVLSKLSYFFNQVNENAEMNGTPLNKNIKDQIESFNVFFPLQTSHATPSNTEMKIYKFLLQTNHFALQNVKVGSFNIDILVHPDIIVEYNGYDHYKFDLKHKEYNLEKFTLDHQYKQRQLKKLNKYKIVNISFKKWHAIYDLEKQYKFLRDMILSVE